MRIATCLFYCAILSYVLYSNHSSSFFSKISSTVKQIVEISEMFDAYDVDKSGTLDSDETIALISAMGHPVDELRAQEIMLHLDLDNDGIISRDEFIAWSKYRGACMQHTHTQRESYLDVYPPYITVYICTYMYHTCNVSKPSHCIVLLYLGRRNRCREHH